MEQKKFKKILDNLPTIAKAVNAFNSENVQQKAFQLLVDALGQEIEEQQPTRAGRKKSSPTTGKKRVKKAEKKKGKQKTTTASIDKSLNLRPRNEQSFKDFYEEKKPTKGSRTYAVCLYYLKNKLKLENVGINQVYTCLKEVGGRIPEDFYNALMIASSRHKYIDTSESSDINITVRGTNLVEQDLPGKKKRKSK